MNVGQQRCNGPESSAVGDWLNGALCVVRSWICSVVFQRTVVPISGQLNLPAAVSTPAQCSIYPAARWSDRVFWPGTLPLSEKLQLPWAFSSSTCVWECRCWVAFPALLRAPSCTLEFDTVIIDFFCQMKLILDYLLHQSKYRLLH